METKLATYLPTHTVYLDTFFLYIVNTTSAESRTMETKTQSKTKKNATKRKQWKITESVKRSTMKRNHAVQWAASQSRLF